MSIHEIQIDNKMRFANQNINYRIFYSIHFMVNSFHDLS